MIPVPLQQAVSKLRSEQEGEGEEEVEEMEEEEGPKGVLQKIAVERRLIFMHQHVHTE